MNGSKSWNQGGTRVAKVVEISKKIRSTYICRIGFTAPALRHPSSVITRVRPEKTFIGTLKLPVLFGSECIILHDLRGELNT